MAATSVAFVGTVGGIGCTRTVMEVGGVLARSGLDVLLFDLDFATQGLGRHVEGSPGVDSTSLLADPEAELEAAVREWDVEGEGRLGVIPSLSPFVTIADAKTEAAGARVADRIEEAADRFDWILFDVPPVVSNEAIGAVTAVDRVVAVIPPTERGIDGLQRERGRLADVGSGFDDVLAVGAGDPPPDASVAIPSLPKTAPTHRPATLSGAGSFVSEVAQATDSLFAADVIAPEAAGALERLQNLGDRLRS